MSDKSLSFNAKNIKIITMNGRVTLRGPVNSEREHSAVVAAAKSAAGDTNVDDQIEVKK
jgi:osmotically-inducible protein OsmY